MKNLLVTSAVVLALGTPLYAQSNDDLVDLIENGISAMNEDGGGLTIGAQEKGDDGSLVLRDIVLAPDDEDFSVAAEFISIRPSSGGDGEVLITMSDVVTLVVDTEDSPPMELVLETENFEVVTNWVDDLAGNPVVSIAAGSLKVTGGNEDDPILKDLDVLMKDLAFRFNFDGGTRSFDGAFSVTELNAVYDIFSPLDEMRQIADMRYGAYQIAFSGENLPEDETGLDVFFDQTGAFNFSGETGPAEFDMEIASEELPMSLKGTAEDGTFEVSLKEGLLSYVADSSGFVYEVAVAYPGLPLPPFEVAFGQIGMDFRIPMRVADTAQDVNMDLSIRDLKVSDALWGMIDPEGAIPRDAANLVIDLGAKVLLAKPLIESFDEDGVEDVFSPLEVGQVTDVDITTVLLNIGGAEVEANGALTVDNSAPIPMPNGAINVSLTGVQGLVNTLTELGLVGAQEAGMAMGMMMAFAKPGEAADEFTSAIEFKDGGVTANGIPLQ